MKINKRCTMEIYITRRSLDYTNIRWTFTYEDEEKMHKGITFPEEVWIIPTRRKFVPMKLK